MGPWTDSAAPRFLSQTRAQSALRRELEALTAAFEPIAERYQRDEPDRTFDVHTSPYRIVFRLDDVAVSFSWIDGSHRTVGDGRLMVIAWGGVPAKSKGVAALKLATPIGESTYSAEAADATHWCWKAEDADGRTYSTPDLAAAWVERASLARKSPIG